MLIRTDVIGRALKSRRGAVAIQLGILLGVLIGMASLGSEIPSIIYKHRQMQNAADAAALGGAAAMTQGYPASPATEAQAITAALGFENGTGGVTVTVNIPPKSGAYVNNTSAIETIVSQPQSLKLGVLFYGSPLNLGARSVAMQGSGNFCMLALDSSSATSFMIGNGTSITLNGCGLAVNSTGNAALSLTSSSALTATFVQASGQVNQSSGSTITAPGGVNTNGASTADPYANVSMPASSGCDYTNFSLGRGVQQMAPGRYCNGVSIGNGATVTMAAGIYYIESGTFSVGGGCTLMGSGVTIVLTQNTSGYANVSIGNGASVTLSAPASGSTSGILFFGDRNAPSYTQNTFGSSSATYTGALYFPTQQVLFPNAPGACACMQVIAWQIQFNGGNTSQFSANCANTGVSAIGGGGSILVE